MQSSRLALVQTRMRAAEVFDALAATARNYLAPAVRRIEPWLAPLRRRSRRELIFAGSGLFVLIVALIVFIASSPRDAAPAGEMVGFFCAPCDHYFELSAGDFEHAWQSGRIRPAGHGHQLALKCPKCGKLTAERSNGRPVRSQPAPAPATPTPG